MKLKKHNYASTAAIVLYCFTSYKSFFYKRFTVLLVVITSLFSSYIYSQQPTISGLENIHISGGATMVTEKSKNEMMVIASSSVKIYAKKAEKEVEKEKEFTKSKIVSDNKEKITKRIREKLEKKIKESSREVMIYSKNSNSNASFEITNSILKQGITNQNNYVSSFINSENDWVVHLNYYQNRDYALYLFYHSKKIENTLFARPPPQVC